MQAKQNSIQLDWQISKISALSSFLSSEDVLPQKDLLEKAAIMKRFKYLLLGKELKTQTDIVKKQYQKIIRYFWVWQNN